MASPHTPTRTAACVSPSSVSRIASLAAAAAVASATLASAHSHNGHRCIHGSEAVQHAAFGIHKVPTDDAAVAGVASSNRRSGAVANGSSGGGGGGFTVVELGTRRTLMGAAAAAGGGGDEFVPTIAVIDTERTPTGKKGEATSAAAAQRPFISFSHHRKEAAEARQKQQQAKRLPFSAAAEGLPSSNETPEPIRIVFRTSHLEDGRSYCSTVGGSSPDLLGKTVSCAKEDVFTAAHRELLTKTVLPRVASIFANILRVRRTESGTILAQSGICGPAFTIPAADQTDGVPFADFIVYVGAAPNPDSVIAWANMCALNYQGRAAIGRANFSPRYLDANSVEDVVKAAVHELIHALGFAPHYITSDAFGTPNVIQSGGTRRGGQPVVLYKGPAGIAAAREHFGCPYLDAVELENDGTANTASGHWERRYHRDDLMSGVATNVMALSELSLSVLVDSTHYFVNKGVSKSILPGYGGLALVEDDPSATTGLQRPRYMHKAGCAVFDSKCNTAEGGAGRYFCFDATSKQQLCTDDYAAIGTCAVGTYPSDLPAWGRYFASSPRLGGVEPYNDYCPIVEPSPATLCSNAQNSAANDAAQGFYYAADSRCFPTSADFAQTGVTAKGGANGLARCLRARCPNNGAMVQFSIGNSGWRSCPSDGSAATVAAPDGYSGTVTCPRSADFCTKGLVTSDSVGGDSGVVTVTSTAPPKATTTTAKLATTTTVVAATTTTPSGEATVETTADPQATTTTRDFSNSASPSAVVTASSVLSMLAAAILSLTA